MKKKSFSNTLSNLIKSIDYFAVTFEFRVDKKQRYGSITGGITYIIYLLFAVFFFAKSFTDYISFSEAKITYIDKSTEPSPALNYKKLNFSYAIQIAFENDTSLSNSYLADLFKIQHSFVFHNKTENSKQKIISKIRNCESKDFHNLTHNFPIFRRFQINDFICFDFYENFTLQGIYTDDYMSYSEILVELNINFLNENKKDANSNLSQEIKNIFNNNLFKFTLFYIDAYKDVDSKDKPLFHKFDSTYTYLDLNYFKRNNVFFQQFNYTEDNNLFYNNYKSYSSMKMFSIQNIDLPIEDRINSKLEQKNYLAKFILRSINNEKLIKVSYVKIPEFLATLSGLLLNTLIILKYFLFLFNNLEAKQKIINKIMKYKDMIKLNNKKTLNYISNKFDDDNFRLRRLSRLSNINNDCNQNARKTNSAMQNAKNMSIDSELDHYSKNPAKTINFECVFSNTEKNKRSETKFIFNTNDSINSDNSSLRTKLNPFNDDIIQVEDVKNIKFHSRPNNLVNDKFNKEADYELKTKKINCNQKNPYEIYPADIINRLFCCQFLKKNKKHLIFENAEKKFDHNLDLVTYMKRMQELDIIKYLLLDKNTLKLVNFISKPCVSLSPKSLQDSEYNQFFESIEDANTLSHQNIDDVKICYDYILAKKDKSYLENRIIQLFDLQIEEIIS